MGKRAQENIRRGAGSVCGQQICLVQPTDGTCQPVPGDPL